MLPTTTLRTPYQSDAIAAAVLSACMKPQMSVHFEPPVDNTETEVSSVLIQVLQMHHHCVRGTVCCTAQ
jgi:hypothetical protein